MRTGEVIAIVNVLNDAFRISPVSDLVERKKQGAEKMRLEAAEIVQHEKVLDELDAVLAEAHAASGLPDEPTTNSALDDFVIRVRLEQSGAT
ncbi:MAG: hypothetical protein HY898_35060 [Deltaproteobacteria bacterium]|nr:hypothetical protein [Deltaproteobacteria bacterium]